MEHLKNDLKIDLSASTVSSLRYQGYIKWPRKNISSEKRTKKKKKKKLEFTENNINTGVLEKSNFHGRK